MIDWFELLKGRSFHELWDVFYHTLFVIIEKYVPKINKLRCDVKRYPKQISKLLNRKRILWRHWQITRSPSAKLRYKLAATACRKAICDHYSGLERRIIDSNNLGQFNRYVNRKLSSKTGIGIIKDSSGKFVSDPGGQGDAFNKFFADSFVTDNNSIPPFPSRTPPDVGLANITFSERDVYLKLKNLKTNSAGGPDLLCPMFLKNVSNFIASPLAFMFEEFFKNSYVPSIWRTAYVRPIFKGGDATSINNYRPISLTCTCC